MATDVRVEIEQGDVIEIDGRRVGDVPRTGEVLEVLGEPGHRHYRVRWDEEHESVFYPARETAVTVRAGRRREPHDGEQELLAVLRDADVEFELLPHRRTVTATSEARALGVLPQTIAKTVIARADGGCVRAVVSAAGRLSLEKLAAAVGSEPRLLDETELAGAYPQFELGAVPPFGGPAGDRVLVDRELAGREYVVLEAGVHDRSLRMRLRDLVDVAGAEVADIASD